MTLREYIRTIALGRDDALTAGGSPNDEARRLFIGDEGRIRNLKLREYATWYRGDSDELLNLYTKQTAIDFQTEPWYWKNKRSYFWSVSATEDDVKRTHSGQPANMVNVMCSIVGQPDVSVADPTLQETLDDILEENCFWATYRDVQLPMTLVEGWGAYKVGWDLDVGDHPYVQYYHAQDVDFVWRNGRLVAMVFFDWYKGKSEGRRYLVTEIRKVKARRDEEGVLHRDLRIITHAWSVAGDEDDPEITAVPLGEVPELQGVDAVVEINDFPGMLARPCIIYRDANDVRLPGRSVYAHNVDKFDMLDAILSQEDNSVQKSTVEELFNTDFLERDQNNLPIMPQRYDRKYTTFAGGRNESGGQLSDQPVQVTQPAIDFAKYSAAAVDCLSQILSGYMSPATIGIGVATQATAESQREKEKVTIATRNRIIEAETEAVGGTLSDLLCAEEYLRTGRITIKKHDVAIKYSEFADASFEEKSGVLSALLDSGAITPELFVERLYGDALNAEERQREIDYIAKAHDPEQQQAMAGMMPGEDEGADPLAAMMGEAE